MEQFERLRRLRQSSLFRDAFAEVDLLPRHFIWPVFVKAGLAKPEPIEAMPGQMRYTPEMLPEVLGSAAEAGIKSTLIFGLTDTKSEDAREAYSDSGAVQTALRKVKAAKIPILLFTDVCLCAYTTHGHCGIVKGSEIENDSSLEVLAKIAVSHAQAGADCPAPSSMMDGQVWAIREALNANGFEQTPIMGYSAKFYSSFYGPFRDAAHSAPSFGDRSTHQHDYRNPRHALREAASDEAEGADILMVKPGLAYLDVLTKVRRQSKRPLAVYNVSGEFSMVKAAAERGWVDERSITLEILTAFRRAGADLIITYHALEATKWLNSN